MNTINDRLCAAILEYAGSQKQSHLHRNYCNKRCTQIIVSLLSKLL